MFENIAKQPPQAIAPQQDPQYYQDPYALPIDPYLANRPSTNMNVQVMNKLFDTGISANEISMGEYEVLVQAIYSTLRRAPNTPPPVIRKWIRDFADISGLMRCDGTKGKVRARLISMMFEINAHVSDGSAAMVGLTGVGAMITQKTEMTQQVKIPQENPDRKKIMGIF